MEGPFSSAPGSDNTTAPTTTTMNIGTDMKDREPSEDDWENMQCLCCAMYFLLFLAVNNEVVYIRNVRMRVSNRLESSLGMARIGRQLVTVS